MYTIEPSCVKVDGILYFISKYSNIPTIKAYDACNYYERTIF
jgi:hypothetical protein